MIYLLLHMHAFHFTKPSFYHTPQCSIFHSYYLLVTLKLT